MINVGGGLGGGGRRFVSWLRWSDQYGEQTELRSKLNIQCTV